MSLIFVYGTLQRDGTRPIPVLFPSAGWVGQGTVPGRLCDFGAYPGLRLDIAGSVIGEVYEVTPAMIAQMDEIERYDANDWHGSYYWRKAVDVQLDNGGIARAEVYEVNPQYFDCISPIASGDWISHAASKGELPAERWPDAQPIAQKVR